MRKVLLAASVALALGACSNAQLAQVNTTLNAYDQAVNNFNAAAARINVSIALTSATVAGYCQDAKAAGTNLTGIVQNNSKALTEANAKIASLEAKDRNREVQAKVAAVKVPAFRPSTQALYAYAMEHTDVKLKVYAKDKDGKDVAAEKSLVEVVDAFVAEINAQGEKWFKSFARTGETRSEDTEEEHAQDEVDKRVKKYLIDHPEVKLYSVAMEKVLASDGELAKRYKDESGQRAAQTH